MMIKVYSFLVKIVFHGPENDGFDILWDCRYSIFWYFDILRDCRYSIFWYFEILRDCRYGEVCNGRQRCEAESSLSSQENLGMDLLKEAVSRSMRIKKRSVRLRNKVRYIFCRDFFKNYYLQFRRPPLVCWLFWSKLFFRGENSTSGGLFIKLPTHKISHKPWRWDFSNVDDECENIQISICES